MFNRHTYQVTIRIEVNINIFGYLSGFRDLTICKLKERCICVVEILNLHLHLPYDNVDQRKRYELFRHQVIR